jgi:hypothetical protein
VKQVIIKRSPNSKQIHEDVFNLLSHKENINLNHTEIPSYSNQIAIIKKIKRNATEDGEKTSYTLLVGI